MFGSFYALFERLSSKYHRFALKNSENDIFEGDNPPSLKDVLLKYKKTVLKGNIIFA